LLSVSFLLVIANETPFIIYGAWLEETFELSLTTLGLASVVIGISEALAELATTQLTDRWGKRRSVILGLLLLALSLGALPILSRLGLVATFAGIVIMIFFFEFAIVSLLPIVTELVPEARASLLGLNLAAMSLGRMLGGVSGGLLWSDAGKGILPHAVAGASCSLVAACILGFRLHSVRALESASE
jgi:predicted MFS family arabinose efflux permease